MQTLRMPCWLGGLVLLALLVLVVLVWPPLTTWVQRGWIWLLYFT